MTIRNAMPFVWKYLLVVATSCLLAFVISSEANAAERQSMYSQPGAHVVEIIDDSWRDEARKRTLPIRIIAPKLDAGATGQRFPVILFSHGLGGSKVAGKFWGEHWASHGYVVVHLQHPGSDESLWKDKAPGAVEASLKGAMTMSNLGLRVGDVHFVIDEVIRRARVQSAPFDRADATKIGMSGHSFGAQTTLSIAGQQNPAVAGQSGFDKRVQAAIAFSPNARSKRLLDRQFGDIRLPFFSVTGTKDGEVLGDGTTVEHRTLPFQHMPAGDKYLLVFEGGDHIVFAGQGLTRRKSFTDRELDIQQDVRASTLAFWNAHLKGDSKARAWLGDKAEGAESIRTILAANDRYEKK
jgi:predicted dienelactone hydrolase